MEGSDHPYYADLHVVTIGAVVEIAKQFTKSSQLIGKLDWFGGINSSPSLLWETDPALRPRYIENAWHHLNREIPFSLRLSDVLAGACRTGLIHRQLEREMNGHASCETWKPLASTAFYCCGVRMDDAEQKEPVCGEPVRQGVHG